MIPASEALKIINAKLKEKEDIQWNEFEDLVNIMISNSKVSFEYKKDIIRENKEKLIELGYFVEEYPRHYIISCKK